MTITAIPNKSFITGQAISFQVAASDSGGGTLTYEASGLPTNVSIDGTSGLITGSAATVGTGTATVTVHGGEDKTSTFTWSVITSKITYIGNTAFQVVPGQNIRYKLAATSASGLPTTFTPSAVCTDLPLDSDGNLSGTLQNYNYAFTCQAFVSVTDGYAVKSIMLNFAVGPVALSSTDSTSLFTGKSSRIRIVGTSSTHATLAYSATSLPAGLSISSSTGAISGTPTAAGTTNVTTTAKDPSGNKTTLKIKVIVATPTIALHLPSSPQVVRNTTSTVTITATDSARENVTFSATGLPAGLAITPSTGAISGKPTARAKSYTVTITATDPGGASATGSFTLIVVSG